MLSETMQKRQAEQAERLRKRAFALCRELGLSTEARKTINYSINGVRSFTETTGAQFRNLNTFLQSELNAKQAPQTEQEFLASF